MICFFAYLSVCFDCLWTPHLKPISEKTKYVKTFIQIQAISLATDYREKSFLHKSCKPEIQFRVRIPDAMNSQVGIQLFLNMFKAGMVSTRAIA